MPNVENARIHQSILVLGKTRKWIDVPTINSMSGVPHLRFLGQNSPRINQGRSQVSNKKVKNVKKSKGPLPRVMVLENYLTTDMKISRMSYNH